jgi:ElaB/YqjD/DUF883 family membrane-anchored ribosome-binding protein
MATTHKAYHPEAGDAFASDLGDLKESFGQLRQDMQQLVRNALESGRSGARAVGKRAADAVDGLKGMGSGSFDAVGEWVAERPLTAALIGLAAGFILAKWMTRR